MSDLVFGLRVEVPRIVRFMRYGPYENGYKNMTPKCGRPTRRRFKRGCLSRQASQLFTLFLHRNK